MATKEARQKHATREWTFLESIASSPSPLDFRVISSRGRSMFYKCKYIFQLFGKVQLGRFLVRKSNLTLFSSPPLTFPLFCGCLSLVATRKRLIVKKFSHRYLTHLISYRRPLFLLVNRIYAQKCKFWSCWNNGPFCDNWLVLQTLCWIN